MKPIHPGRILKREITARKLSANKLALSLRVPSGRITQILNEKRGVSGDTGGQWGHGAAALPLFWKQCSILDEPSSQIRTGGCRTRHGSEN